MRCTTAVNRKCALCALRPNERYFYNFDCWISSRLKYHNHLALCNQVWLCVLKCDPRNLSIYPNDWYVFAIVVAVFFFFIFLSFFSSILLVQLMVLMLNSKSSIVVKIMFNIARWLFSIFYIITIIVCCHVMMIHTWFPNTDPSFIFFDPIKFRLNNFCCKWTFDHTSNYLCLPILHFVAK